MPNRRLQSERGGQLNKKPTQYNQCSGGKKNRESDGEVNLEMSLRNILRVELIMLKDGLHVETAPVNCEPCIEGYALSEGVIPKEKSTTIAEILKKGETKPIVVNAKDAVTVGVWNVSSAGQMASGGCRTHHAPTHHRHHRFSSYSTAVIFAPSKFTFH